MNLGFSETAFLVVLGLLLFGPKKLPEIGRHIGRFMAEFKRASAEFQNQLNDEVRQLELEVEETKRNILPPEGIAPRVNAWLSGDHQGEGPPLEAEAPVTKTGEEASATETDQRAARPDEAAPQDVLGRAVTQGPNA